MNRNSKQAQEIVRQVGRPDVTGRHIEDWSHARLLAPDGTPLEAQAALVAGLADLGTKGRDPDRVALILAARGLGAARLPDAIARAWGVKSAGNLASGLGELIPSPDPDTDEGDRAVRGGVEFLMSAAQGAVRVPEGLAPLVRLLSGLAHQIGENVAASPVLDSSVRLPTGKPAPEATEQVVFSILYQSVAIMRGGSPTSPEVLSRIAPTDERVTNPDVVGESEEVQSLAGAEEVAHRFAKKLDALSIDVLVIGAKVMRDMLPAQLPAGPDLDYLAGSLAPVGLALMPFYATMTGIGWPPASENPLEGAPEEA